MDGALKWIMTLYAWLVFLHCFTSMSIKAQHVGSKISNNNNNPGFISIDCGADNDYLDDQTGIWYQTDTDVVETGTNHKTSPNVDLNYLYFGKQLNTLRSFPDGKRNCYTLKPNQSKNYNFLVRAFFAYGNYDGQNRTPIFDLYLGVNYWDTIGQNRGQNRGYFFTVIIQSSSANTDAIHVCLVNTGQGIPYISTLELRPVSSLTYPLLSNSESLLYLQGRFDVGAPRLPLHSRYMDDIYGRVWRSFDQIDWYSFNKSITFDPTTAHDIYELPVEVWRTAAKTINVFDALEFDYNLWWEDQAKFDDNFLLSDLDKSSKYYVIFYFLEIEQLPLGKKRIINITLNDESLLSEPLVLDYLKPISINNISATQGRVNFRIFATPESDVPPILNAFEVWRVITQLPPPTDARDVDAIMNIKSTYQISRLNWQGDPCVPHQFAWEGLNCNSDINPRIISLNISSSGLKGNITPSISNLHLIEYLDLSNNNLTGDVPGFLSQLCFLRVLNLQGNQLSGVIPAELIEKSTNGSLIFNYSGNPTLCSPNSCNKISKNKAIIPIVVALVIVASILAATITFWVYKGRQPVLKAMNKLSHYSKFNKSLQSKEQQFTYAEVLRITNNFERVVGKGGFGIVYHGYLGNTQVAVKVIYPSAQGDLQFQGEAKLLTMIHHKCLIALIGYCYERTNLALIYEYMANGDLAEHLSGKSEHIISWKQRLQIAIDAAEGLEYLHNGCKPPIVHRDVKSRNILLNEKFRGKLADFGLSKMFTDEDDTHMYTMIVGTPGYIDPEYSRSNMLTDKSDVYSFGVVLLEIITGQPVISRTKERIHIVKWVESMLPSKDIDNIMDSRLQGEYDTNSARRALDIAMACVELGSFNRPTMSLVVRELKQCLPMEMALPSDLHQGLSYSSIDISFDRISGESSLVR